MPEVIEIKLYADFITKRTLNKKLVGINIVGGRYKKHSAFESYNQIIKLLPSPVLSVGTKGKFTYIKFNKFILGITLGLSGGYFYKKNASDKLIHGLHKSKTKYDKAETAKYMEQAKTHINVEFIFEDGVLYFYDMLSFGTISVLTDETLEKKLKAIGVDMLDQNTTFDMFYDRISKSKDKEIGNILLNQKLVSGIGNYLRADVLWLSKISPFRKLTSLSKKDLKLIYNNTRTLIWGQYNNAKGIKLGIITDDKSLPSHYDRDFFVYSKEKDIHDNIVTKEKLYEGSQIRYIYWVKIYQK